MKIYMDVCCLNRPFDDQNQDRIHLEAESVLSILSFVEKGKWHLLNSDAILYEINKIPDTEKKIKVRLVISLVKECIQLNKKIFERAEQIQKIGVKSFDALHVACAEAGKADIFLTTDDQLLKKLRQHSDKIKVKAANPLEWVEEVI